MFSNDDFRPMHSSTFQLCFVFRIGPHNALVVIDGLTPGASVIR